jgi:four helix bundle protein
MQSEPEDLRTRTKRFALSAIRLSPNAARCEEGMILRRQFLRSATSIGAQYREATRARSDAEFISKMESALQEIDETIYWLELLSESQLCDEAVVNPVLNEAIELIRIFTTIVRKRKGIG